MNRRRCFLRILASAVVLLAQLQAWSVRECSMCGASCHCAARTSSKSCCVRAAGCGGGADAAVAATGAPLWAVLVAAAEVAAPLVSDRTDPAEAGLLPHPVRDPLDRPPRVSC